MGGITRSIVRFGVIAGLAVGGATLIAGPGRVAALAHQARATLISQIDDHIGDPAAMRQQLRDLEAQYPKRISEVRAQLAEIETQTTQLARDKSMSQRVVELAMDDKAELTDLIARAETAVTEHGSARLVRIVFDDRTIALDEAYTRANTINETVNLYSARAEDITTDLDSLENDAEILKVLLSKLETEQAEFQSQIAQLDAKIDAIARKEKMADLMEGRQKRIDELSRFEVTSLDQLKSKLARQHAELDARIASATSRDRRESYEDRARFEVSTDASRTMRITKPAERPASPTIIVPQHDDDQGPVAQR